MRRKRLGKTFGKFNLEHKHEIRLEKMKWKLDIPSICSQTIIQIRQMLHFVRLLFSDRLSIGI